MPFFGHALQTCVPWIPKIGRGSFWILVLALGNACSNRSSIEQSSVESEACTQAQSYPGGTTIMGSAQFQRFADGSTGLTTKSLAPIRRAEVEILNLVGAKVNCGWTDNSGNFSLQVPAGATAYQVNVLSRAYNSWVRASILNSPSERLPYAISTNVNVTSGQSQVSATLSPALVSGAGGAFNIFEQILVANEYLRAQVAGFSLAPKSSVYWQLGVSPGVYLGNSSMRVSFFNSSETPNLPLGIYILGGISGSVCSDTDHFDNSVILHEYAHFLENSFASSDSPGGAHNGNQLLDPRLAWSEGWANYFQAAALGRNFYRDTTSNADCGDAKLSFPDFSLENRLSIDTPSSTIEAQGGFREFSIARTLYDVHGTIAGDTDGFTTNLGFAPIWKSFTSLSSGIYAFRSAFIFNPILRSEIQTNYSSQLAALDLILGNTNEVQPTSATASSLRFYGSTLSPQASTCSASLSFGAASTVAVESTNNTYLRSNNRYFRYNYSGTSAQSSLTLNFTTGGSSYDLDLYIYRQDHVLTSLSTVALASASTSGGSESVQFTGLIPGTYLVRVSAIHNPSGTATSFNLRNTNGEYLCPP